MPILAHIKYINVDKLIGKKCKSNRNSWRWKKEGGMQNKKSKAKIMKGKGRGTLSAENTNFS